MLNKASPPPEYREHENDAQQGAFHPRACAEFATHSVNTQHSGHQFSMPAAASAIFCAQHPAQVVTTLLSSSTTMSSTGQGTYSAAHLLDDFCGINVGADCQPP